MEIIVKSEQVGNSSASTIKVESTWLPHYWVGNGCVELEFNDK